MVKIISFSVVLGAGIFLGGSSVGFAQDQGAAAPADAEAAKPFFLPVGGCLPGGLAAGAAAGPAAEAGPKRRGYDGPLDSTPFPGSDYSVGGTPVIGAPDTQTYPLMQAINGNRGRVKIYGWLNGGFDVSSSNKGDGANSPAAYYYNPNRVIPDQQVLYIERLPDTVQTEHIDWGFRFAQLYGQDYRYTTSKGVFSQQLLARNHEYGYDPVMYYFDLYFQRWRRG